MEREGRDQEREGKMGQSGEMLRWHPANFHARTYALMWLMEHILDDVTFYD